MFNDTETCPCVIVNFLWDVSKLDILICFRSRFVEGCDKGANCVIVLVIINLFTGFKSTIPSYFGKKYISFSSSIISRLHVHWFINFIRGSSFYYCLFKKAVLILQLSKEGPSMFDGWYLEYLFCCINNSWPKGNKVPLGISFAIFLWGVSRFWCQLLFQILCAVFL